MTIHSILVQSIYTLAGDLPTPLIIAPSILLFTMWTWVAHRPSLPKKLPVDNKNIILAFYTGNNGSFIMNLFQTMSEPVSSMCVLSGNYCLQLKKGKDFQFTENHGFFRDWEDNYYLIDTGVESTDDFVEKMRDCGNMKANWFGLRISCIIKIRDLLGEIGEEWRPQGLLELVPSGYFRKAYGLS